MATVQYKSKTKRIVPRNRKLATYLDKSGRVAKINFGEYVDVCPGHVIGAVMIRAEDDASSFVPRLTVQLEDGDLLIQFIPCIRLDAPTGIYVKEWRSLEACHDPEAEDYYFSFDRDFLNEF